MPAPTYRLYQLLQDVNDSDLRMVDFSNINSIRSLKTKYAKSIEFIEKTIAQDKVILSNITDTDRIIGFVSDSQTLFHDILKTHVRAAFKINYDIATSGWPDHLLNKITEGGIVSVMPRVYRMTNSEQPSTSVTWEVSIYKRMAKFLGGPNEYANAVKATRGALGYGNKVSGRQASGAWYYNLWKPARVGEIELTKEYRKASKSVYAQKLIDQDTRLREGKIKKKVKLRVSLAEVEKFNPGITKKLIETTKKKADFYYLIMNTRLRQMEGLAPYWYLLEHGLVKLPSDKGGRALPQKGIVATNFTRKAEQEILEYCQNNWRNYTTKKELNLQRDIERLTPLLQPQKDILYLLDQMLNASSNYSARSLQVAITKLSIALEPAIKESRRFADTIKLVEKRIEILATQMTIGEAPARTTILYTKNNEFRMRMTEIQAQVMTAISSRGIIPPSVGELELIQARIARMQAELASIVLKRKQTKQLTTLKYTPYEIERMPQRDIDNILLYKIRAGKIIGPKVKL